MAWIEMYNFFVSSNEEAWNGSPFEIELSRCIREYTDTELTEKFGALGRNEIIKLRRFPCIFAYETGRKKDPHFGVISDVKKRSDNEVRVEYELIDVGQFLSYTNFEDLSFDLDIGKWEMNRTHWALKDVRLAPALNKKNIRLPSWACSTTKAVDISTHIFDVALSFPGEVRDYVESITEELERLIGPNSYFYDKNYAGQLARPRLDTFLQGIYGERAKLIVVFVCEDYQNKDWCGIEFRAISEILKRREDDRIMFVRMDDGHVDGVFNTDGYLRSEDFGPREIARFIEERIEQIA